MNCKNCGKETSRIMEPDGYEIASCSPECDAPLSKQLEQSLRRTNAMLDGRRVFAVQNPHKIDRSSGANRPVFDLRWAKEHGQIIFLLDHAANPARNPDADTGPLIHELGRKLASFRDTDSLLLIGNPVLIGLATAIAARINRGRVRMLQWDTKTSRYVVVQADLGGDHGR